MRYKLIIINLWRALILQLILIICIIFIGCGPSDAEAKKLGFVNSAEMKEALNNGAEDAEKYAAGKGFNSLKEMRYAEELGFENVESFAKSKGFTGRHEMRYTQEIGYENMLDYVKSKGFPDVKTYRTALEVGQASSFIEYKNFINEQVEREKLAARRAADPYFDYPYEQRLFIEIVSDAQNNTRANGGNKMALGGIKHSRTQLLCNSISYQVNNWIGTIEGLNANSDGWGVISIYVAPNIRLKTWNNSLSDIGDNTLIPPGSTLFNQASNFKKGDEVIFSGSFISDYDNCFKESSLTLNGGLTDPEFIFIFNSITLK